MALNLAFWHLKNVSRETKVFNKFETCVSRETFLNPKSFYILDEVGIYVTFSLSIT